MIAGRGSGRLKNLAVLGYIMASPANSADPPPSLSSDIERKVPVKAPLSLAEEERLDNFRLQEDARSHRDALLRNMGATEPASAYKNVLLTDKQINYLLVILKPYLSPIAEECRVKLESA
jgi:hypothetical protein